MDFPLPTSGTRPWVFETEIYKEKNGEVFRHKSMFSETESVCITSTSEHREGEPIGGLETVPSRLLWSEFSSVQFSRSVMSDSLRLHESQHARPPCPSPSPRVHSISGPSSRWYHLILGRPLFLLPPIPHSIRVFSNESTLRMKWPKYWSFSFSIIPSKDLKAV